VDDVLIPKLGSTYLDEFQLLSAAHPNAAGFTYNRYNTELETSASPKRFSLSRLISSARIATEWEDGKYVVNTSRVETAWIHYPGRQKLGTEMYTVPEEVRRRKKRDGIGLWRDTELTVAQKEKIPHRNPIYSR